MSLHAALPIVRRPDRRWPIPPDIAERLPGQRIDAVRRRAKYLLLDTAAGSALLHLGMSGSLRVLPADAPVRVHDHFDIALAGSGRGGGRVLRFNRSEERRVGQEGVSKCIYRWAPYTKKKKKKKKKLN